MLLSYNNTIRWLAASAIGRINLFIYL